MTNTTENLGAALTVLGLEDEFLANGQLTTFPLLERGRIATTIVDEKLRLGRWETVIQMIYGGFGKADALFEGDRAQLRERILASLQQHPRTHHSFGQKTLDALVRANEIDLLFKLGTSIPLDYESFNNLMRSIPSEYLKDAVHGEERTRDFHKIAGKRALDEKEYGDALRHFTAIKDTASIATIFEQTMANQDSSLGLLESIALSDQAQREARLQQIVQYCLAVNPNVSRREGEAVEVFEMVRKQGIVLSDEQKAVLHARIAKEARTYDFDNKKIGKDPTLLLMWAKEHATTDPRHAYEIFKEQGFEGDEVLQAVREGLALEHYKNEHRVLEPYQVTELHLRRVYESAPFKVQVRIACHLRDKQKLQDLSRRAKKRGKFEDAYRFWVSGEGDMNGKYITAIRERLIRDAMKNDHDYMNMSFLADNDREGHIRAFDALMAQTENDKRHLEVAHGLAFKMGDEERTQRARERMFACSPEWALGCFGRKSRSDARDEKGINYVINTIASQHGVAPSTLKDLVVKYQE